MQPISKIKTTCFKKRLQTLDYIKNENKWNERFISVFIKNDPIHMKYKNNKFIHHNTYFK